MTVTFYLVVLNHHQVYLADELYNLLGDGFRFVELCENCENKGDSTDYSTRNYLIRDWLDEAAHKVAMNLLLSSDICVFGGSDSQYLLNIRARKGLLCFDISERWFKKGVRNVFSPRLFTQFLSYHLYLHKKPIYKLCASAFAASDFSRLHMYRGRCFKWGYFTQVGNVEFNGTEQDSDHVTSIMWCARFIKWKHPELPILMAKHLKERNSKVAIDMFGTGPEESRCKKLCYDLGVENLVFFKGAQPNEVIRKEMKEHDFFIFTSDKNEGWGVVLNEAMGSGCTVVASDEIGAVPYLIKDGYNGKIYRSGDVESLTDGVITLMNNPQVRNSYAINAFYTITQNWSPKTAAFNFVHLSEMLLQGLEPDIESGPCSLADN